MKIKLRAFLIFCFSCLVFNHSYSQSPLQKQWDHRFGGVLDDALTCFVETSDGGFLLGGFSESSAGGDKTQPCQGNWDYWVVKIDSLGIKQWDKTFGGIGSDILMTLQQTADGGYMLGGYSLSGISGDKTQASQGNNDYWIVKLNAQGVKQWDKGFGGTVDDFLFSLQQTTDGGYILGGYTNSGIRGDKSQANWDTTANTHDLWIIKIDSLGTKQWDKDFGGTNEDYLFTIEQTDDAGYILGSASASPVSGDKTQPAWSGSYDYWMLKTDSSGLKQWDRNFGSTDNDFFHSLQQTADGGYILGGYSGSGVSGDKTAAGNGFEDFWMIKTDAMGIKQWDKCYGGSIGEDDFGNISQTADGGYLLAGNSYSHISGDKSENNLGNEQTWVIKTDSLGVKQWDKTLLTNATGDDEKGLAIQTKDGCFAMANYTAAGIGGNKTEANRDSILFLTSDYWIIKFCDTTLTTNIVEPGGVSPEFVVSPNPFSSEILLSVQKESIYQSAITIKNILGQTVYNFSNPPKAHGKGSFTFDLSFLSNGIYFLEVIINSGKDPDGSGQAGTAGGERMDRKIVKK